MSSMNMLHNDRLNVSNNPPYDPLQAFVRDNHIALQGSESGPLDDLVFAVKDVLKVVGSTWGNGHPEWLRTHGPDEFTSSIVTQMMNSGADLVGKTICDELCFSISGENWNYGSPLNPNDPRRLTGGSSSGACAATAGGLADFAFGSDCLGSVRVPASYNGLLGMRPTYQRVPTDGEVPYCPSMDVLGFVAHTPDTFKRVANEVLGPDKETVQFKKLLVAEDCFDAVEQDVADALEPAVDYLGDQLETIEKVTVSPEGLEKWSEIFKVIQGYEVWQSYGGWIRKYRPQLSPGPKERLEWASTITMQEYREACSKRQAVIDRMDELVTPDALLCLPTAASVAPLKTAPLEDIDATRQQSTNLLSISPLSSTPQITLPMTNQYEVPLGISLIGAQGTDFSMATFAAETVGRYLKS